MRIRSSSLLCVVVDVRCRCLIQEAGVLGSSASSRKQVHYGVPPSLSVLAGFSRFSPHFLTQSRGPKNPGPWGVAISWAVLPRRTPPGDKSFGDHEGERLLHGECRMALRLSRDARELTGLRVLRQVVMQKLKDTHHYIYIFSIIEAFTQHPPLPSFGNRSIQEWDMLGQKA